MARVTSLLGLLLILAIGHPAASQEPAGTADGERPRIGLVLSGGGARGAAHIGVLRVLEELRIPIDSIAGTSMGAVVGGLYASGMSVDAIERALLDIDWDDVFRDQTSFRDLDFRRKQDERNFLIDFNIGIKHGKLVLPPGVIQGQKLSLLLKELTLPTIGTRNFDELPIPFRAVAADISTGEVVVLQDGDLANAIRASMSIPGLIAPEPIGDRKLVDGMVAENLPVRVAQEMGADIIIAVDVGRPLEELERRASFLQVSSQMLEILMSRNVAESMALLDEDDVFVRPDLEGFNPASFERSAEVIAVGIEAARAKADELSRLSLSEDEYAGLRTVQHPGPFEPPTVHSIRIQSDTKLDPKAIRSRMKTQVGKPLDLELLRRDLGRIYGISIFEEVEFDLEQTDQGNELVIKAREKTWGPPYLKFKAFLTDDFDGSASYLLGTRITYLPVNSYGAEWRNELEFGEQIRALTEFFQPLGPGSPYFVAPRLEYIKRDIDVFSDAQRVAELEFTAFVAGLDVGRLLGNWGEYRLGMFHVEGDINIETGPPGLGSENISEARAETGLVIDTLDNPFFPRDGFFGGALLTLVREDLGADQDFELLETSANHAVSLGPTTFIYGLEYATSLDQEGQAVDTFALGGFLNLSGLDYESIRGEHALLARVAGYRQLGWEERTPFGIPYYLGGSLELGNVFEDRSDITYDNLLWSGSAFLGLNTFLGPIYLGLGATEGGERTAFLFVGGLPF